MERHLVPADGPEDLPIAKGVLVTDELCKKHGCDAVLLLPTKGNLSGTTVHHVIGDAAVNALAKGRPVTLPSGHTMRLETPLTYRWGGRKEIVLAVYAGKKMLDLLDGLQEAPACVVVPWTMAYDGVQEWIATWNPLVVGAAPTAQAQLIANPMVERAMRSLSSAVNKSTGLSHPRDRQSAIELLRELRRHGEDFAAADLRAWAMREGWTPKGADELQEIAEAVIEGRRIGVAGLTSWRPDIIDQFRKEVRGKASPPGGTKP